MNLDQLIEHLEAVRERHGGGLTVMVGQRNPDDDAIWSGVNVDASNINETASHDPMLSALKKAPSSSGWLWFEFPKGGIAHRRRKPRGLLEPADVELAAREVEQALAVTHSVQRKLKGGSTAVSEEDAKAALARLSSDHPLLKPKATR